MTQKMTIYKVGHCNKSEKFVAFAMKFVSQMRDEWWKLSPEDKKRSEQVLVNGKIYVNDSAIVHTPTLSKIYTLAEDIKKAPDLSDAHLVELAGSAPASIGLR